MTQFDAQNKGNTYEIKVLQAIHDYPEENHNGILRIVVPKHMAKNTAEKSIKRLIDRKVIIPQTVGNKKYYRIIRPELNKTKENLDKGTIIYYQILLAEIQNLEKQYSKLDTEGKTVRSLWILQLLTRLNTAYTIQNAIIDPEKLLMKNFRVSVQLLIKKIFDIILNDKKSRSLVYPIVSQSFHLVNEAIDYQSLTEKKQ